MTSLSTKLQDMYIKMKAGDSQNCQECIRLSEKSGQKLIGPLPIFHVGEDYERDKHKTLFIGSVANGWEKELDGKKLSTSIHTHQLMKDVNESFIKLMDEPTTVYLRTLKTILEKVYGNVGEGLRRTAITNIIHCNYGIPRDNMPAHVAKHCAYNKDFQLTKHEINILNPNTIISLAGRKREGYLKNNWGLDQKKICYCGSPAARGRSINDITSVVEKFLSQDPESKIVPLQGS